MNLSSIKQLLLSKGARVLLTFVVASLVVMLLAPRDRSFQYTFSSGKPWAYDLVTAPYDFPIYKSAEQLRMEQDSIRQETLPVYTYDADLLPRKLNQLHDSYEKRFTTTIPRAYYDFLREELRQYYTNGIIQAANLS